MQNILLRTKIFKTKLEMQTIRQSLALTLSYNISIRRGN